MRPPYRSGAMTLSVALLLATASLPTPYHPVWAQTPAQPQSQSPGARPDTAPPQEKAQEQTAVAPEGSMTLERLGAIVQKLDAQAKNPQPNIWQFEITKVPVILIADKEHNRMRLLVSVRKSDELNKEDLLRIAQANFDTALDARYAIAGNILWATYIHSLSTLHNRQFITAIGQTVNLALTFGTTYSSGALAFQGGDSRDILRRQLIEQLLEKGTEI